MKIEITGNFEKEELEEILMKVREVEQRKPSRHINVWVEAPELTSEEIVEVVKKPFNKNFAG